MQVVYLVRHAAYQNDVDNENPGLSNLGYSQASDLAIKIGSETKGSIPLVISSPALRASQTAESICKKIGLAPPTLFNFLWSDNKHAYDFEQFAALLDDNKKWPLVVVTHLEYVHQFPSYIGHVMNNADYAEGVVMNLGLNTIRLISHREAKR